MVFSPRQLTYTYAGPHLKACRQKALLAPELLHHQQVREKGYADFYIKLMADLYKQEGQEDCFAEAENLLVSLVSHFRTGEKRRLDAQTAREIARKPTDNASLSALVVKDLYKPSKSQNRNQARSRSGSNKRATKKARIDSPAPVHHRNQPCSNIRGRPRNNSRDPKTGSSQRRPAHSPQGQKQQRCEANKYLPKQCRQDNARDRCPPARQANTGRPSNPSSNRKRSNQDLSEGARNLLAAIQELGTQFP